MPSWAPARRRSGTKNLSVERLRSAVRQAAGDDELRQTAGALERRIQSEDGVARAVELIGKLITTCCGRSRRVGPGEV